MNPIGSGLSLVSTAVFASLHFAQTQAPQSATKKAAIEPSIRRSQGCFVHATSICKGVCESRVSACGAACAARSLARAFMRACNCSVCMMYAVLGGQCKLPNVRPIEHIRGSEPLRCGTMGCRQLSFDLVKGITQLGQRTRPCLQWYTVRVYHSHTMMCQADAFNSK